MYLINRLAILGIKLTAVISENMFALPHESPNMFVIPFFAMQLVILTTVRYLTSLAYICLGKKRISMARQDVL